MESKTPTHIRTAPKMKRKKMSLLTCLSLWSPSGSAVPTEDMARREKASDGKVKCVSFSSAVSDSELVLELSAARLASTHTLCASGRGGRAACLCTGPGGAGSAGTAAGRGKAGLTGGSWPSPGAALLGPGRWAPERRTRGGKTRGCTQGKRGVGRQTGTLHQAGGTRELRLSPWQLGPAAWRAAGRGAGPFAA